jgi:transmembrane sensor
MDNSTFSAASLPDELFDRYLRGQATPEEQVVVERTAGALPGFRAWAAAIRSAEAPGGGELSPERMREMIRRLSHVPDHAVPRDTDRPVPARRRSHLLALGMSAVAIALIVGVYRTHHDRPSSAPFVAGTSYTTRTGEKAIVTLRDGSTVTLAPQTTLQLATDFGRTSRTLRLKGEAYFSVPKSTGLPFIVQTVSATTRVLGTTFDVRQYATDRHARITVEGGRVSVARQTAPHTATTVAAGYGSIVGDSAIDVHDANDVATWQSGRLMFRSASVTEVLQTLTRWYGYRFQVLDSAIVQQTVTLSLSTESSAAALATLENILQIDLTVKDTVVTLRARTNAGPHRQLPARQERGSLSTSEVGR